jgi:Flp pilus assembly protein TadD
MFSLSRQSILGTLLLFGAATLCGCKSLPTVTWKKEKTNKEKQEAMAEIPPPEETKNLIPEKPTAKMMVDFAHVRASMGEYSDAGNLFEKAIKAEPKNVDARVGLAKIKMQLGHPDQAVEKLQEGIARMPKAAPLWNELGIAYTKMEKYPEAIEALEKAIKFEPDTDLYRQNLAGVLVVTGEVNKAYKLYSQEMSEADARVQIARILGGQGKMAECRKQIDAAIKADPTNEYAHHLSDEIDPQFLPAGYSAPR